MTVESSAKKKTVATQEKPLATEGDKTTDSIRPIRATWLDWLGAVSAEEAIAHAQPFLSKDELLSKLANKGVKATGSDLVYWQQRGVIPYPNKRRAGRSSVSTYPSWMPEVINLLRHHQQSGLRLDQIQNRLQVFVTNAYGRPLTAEGKVEIRRNSARRELWRRLDQIRLSLAQVAEDLDTTTGLTTGKVEIVFHPLSEEQVAENLLNHAIQVAITFPKFNSAGIEDERKRDANFSNPFVSEEVGFVERRINSQEEVKSGASK